MASVFLRWSLFGAVLASPAFSLTLTCDERTMDYNNAGGTGVVTVVECMADEDIYFSNGVNTVLSTAADSPWANPIALSDGPVLPAPSTMWARNFVLECGSASIAGAEPTRWPTDYLFVSDPVENPFDPVMAAFGAFLNKTAFVERKLGFVFFPELVISGEHEQPMQFPIAKDAWATCVTDGSAKLKVVGDETAADQTYRMTDSAGTAITGVEAVITMQDLASGCSRSTAATIKSSFEALRIGLANAVNEEQLDALKATVQGIRARKTFASCYALMETFYDEETAQVTLVGSKVCKHASDAAEWANDPCCNPMLRWSQCCAAGTIDVAAKKCAEIDGGGQCKVNTDAMGSCSPEGQTAMTFVIQEIVAPSIFETNHPQYGCSIAAAEVTGRKKWEQARHWVDTCESAVRDGKSKLGTDSCEQDGDCFTSCKDDHGTKRCERAAGSGGIMPSFRCMLSQAKMLPIVTHIGALIGATIGDDTGEINEDTSEGDPKFLAAFNKFKDLATEENCGGESAGAGWCANSLTKDQCEKLSVTEVSSPGSWMKPDTAVKWIDDPSNEDVNVGWCVMANDHPSPSVCSSGQGGQDGQGEQSGVASGGNRRLEESGTVDSSPRQDGDQQHLCGWGWNFAFRSNTEAQTACDNAVKNIHACVLDSGSQQTSEQDCTDNSGTWTAYGAGTFHRLQSMKSWGRDETGNYKEFVTQGDPTKCAAEKACNWDPWGQHDADTEDKCTGAGAPESIAGTGANDGKKMFCGRCESANKCGGTMMSLPTCMVRPWDYAAEVSENSGTCAETGSANGLAAATYDANSWHNRGQMVHGNCYRTGEAFDTLEECMPVSICPPSVVDAEGRVYNDCSHSFCYNTYTQGDCNGLTLDGNSFWWASNMKNGEGLCRSWGNTKQQCEDFGFKWWEGRAWVNGWMVTEAACNTGYCGDDKPGHRFRTTCESSNICTKRCEVCESGRRHEGGGADRMCYNPATTDQTVCTSAGGWDWDATAEKCKKSDFTGTAADCKALDASYIYKDCASLEPAKCKAGCKLSGYTEGENCWAQNACMKADGTHCWANFNWKDEVCMVRDGVQTEAECTGVQSGAPQWTVTDEETNKIKNALQCRWETWGECPDQAACENSGHCEDWELEFKGSCIKALEPNDRGERKDCYGDYSPQSYMWAGDFGCKDMTIQNEAACLAKNTGDETGWSWLKKATTRATCDAHGKICKDRFRDWKVFGGFTDEATCLACGDRLYANKAEYHGGKWQKPAMRTGSWKAREWASKNSWESMISRDKLEGFAEMAMSKMVGEVYTTEITCLLAPLVDPLLLTACACGTGESAECDSLLAQSSAILEIALAETTLDCQTVTSSPPVEMAAGKIEYGNASCEGQASSVLEKIFKVAVSGSASSRRLSSDQARRLSACAAHAIVKNANGGTCGQKMGPGLSSQTNGASFCVTPTVPANEVCSEYTINDFVEIAANGAVGTPLGITTTIDTQGRYCGTMPKAGRFMPIKRVAAFADVPQDPADTAQINYSSLGATISAYVMLALAGLL